MKLDFELLAGVLVSLAAIWGVIASIMSGQDPKDENHGAEEPHAGGKA